MRIAGSAAGTIARTKKLALALALGAAWITTGCAGGAPDASADELRLSALGRLPAVRLTPETAQGCEDAEGTVQLRRVEGLDELGALVGPDGVPLCTDSLELLVLELDFGSVPPTAWEQTSVQLGATPHTTNGSDPEPEPVRPTSDDETRPRLPFRGPTLFDPEPEPV